MRSIFSRGAGICLVAGILLGSCRKTIIDTPKTEPDNSRKVQFRLYTDKNFSTNNTLITFTLAIEDASGRKLWDSSFAPVPLPQIPDASHKWLVEKKVPGNNPGTLRVIVSYYLENIGYSGTVEAFAAGETLKVFDYNFQ
ncbi:MAG: hypothetical protein JO301_03075 [Chitinophagaceae bacterium]|nr:hypothetical protein [Chitinophagaceae bacterium]